MAGKVKTNKRHFTCFNWQRSHLGSLKLEQLSEADNDYLVAPFLEVEIMETMCDTVVRDLRIKDRMVSPLPLLRNYWMLSKIILWVFFF